MTIDHRCVLTKECTPFRVGMTFFFVEESMFLIFTSKKKKKALSWIGHGAMSLFLVLFFIRKARRSKRSAQIAPTDDADGAVKVLTAFMNAAMLIAFEVRQPHTRKMYKTIN